MQWSKREFRKIILSFVVIIMVKVALVDGLGFTNLNTAFYKKYVNDIRGCVDKINPDIILFIQKYRVDTGDSHELHDIYSQFKDGCKENKKCIKLKPGITTLENMREVRKYLEDVTEAIDEIHVVAPNMFIYKELFLTTKYLWHLVGLEKSEHDLYEAVIDILKSLTMEQLINSREYKLGKFNFHSIEGQWPIQEIYRQIISGMREMIGEQYPDIDKNYTMRRNDQNE